MPLAARRAYSVGSCVCLLAPSRARVDREGGADAHPSVIHLGRAVLLSPISLQEFSWQSPENLGPRVSGEGTQQAHELLLARLVRSTLQVPPAGSADATGVILRLSHISSLAGYPRSETLAAQRAGASLPGSCHRRRLRHTFSGTGDSTGGIRTSP